MSQTWKLAFFGVVIAVVHSSSAFAQTKTDYDPYSIICHEQTVTYRSSGQTVTSGKVDVYRQTLQCDFQPGCTGVTDTVQKAKASKQKVTVTQTGSQCTMKSAGEKDPLEDANKEIVKLKKEVASLRKQLAQCTNSTGQQVTPNQVKEIHSTLQSNEENTRVAPVDATVGK